MDCPRRELNLVCNRGHTNPNLRGLAEGPIEIPRKVEDEYKMAKVLGEETNGADR